MELPFPSPGGVMDSITSPALMCDTMHKVVPAREVHQSPSVQNFFLGLHHIAWLMAHIADLSL